VAGARELWIRPGPATCATNAGRSAFAFFLKQWGTYRSNPLVQEDGLPLADAQDRDPRTNGKGGRLARWPPALPAHAQIQILPYFSVVEHRQVKGHRRAEREARAPRPEAG